MLATLQRSGKKLTAQRVAIVKTLARDASHPTAQELFERLAPAMPSMSFATVYNTLDALVREGLCRARALAPGPTRFDPNAEAHDHAVCDRCGRVVDVMTKGAGEPPRETHVAGFSVTSVEQIYRGICAVCAGAEARRPRRPARSERPAPG